MDEFLNHFAFRSAIPGGSLLEFLLPTVVGGMALRYASIAKDKRKKVVGWTIVAIVAARIILGFSAESLEIDLNPQVQESDLIGTWRDGAVDLQIRSDHTYSRKDRGGLENGHWQLNDCSLEMTTISSPLRVITVNGLEHIIREPGDPDTWDGHLGLTRVGVSDKR